VITKKKVTVYNAICAMCEAKGPDAFSERQAHELALNAGWKGSEDYYICHKPEHSKWRFPGWKCKHENMGADGICNDCGSLLRFYDYHLYTTVSFILDGQKESGEIDEIEYKENLEKFKEAAIALGTWRPARRNSS
jgi:hypothetical protein